MLAITLLVSSIQAFKSVRIKTLVLQSAVALESLVLVVELTLETSRLLNVSTNVPKEYLPVDIGAEMLSKSVHKSMDSVKTLGAVLLL